MKIHPLTTKTLHSDRQTDRQTTRHDEENSRFLQFCESVYKRPSGICKPPLGYTLYHILPFCNAETE